jgi:hypothetical protein
MPPPDRGSVLVIYRRGGDNDRPGHHSRSGDGHFCSYQNATEPELRLAWFAKRGEDTIAFTLKGHVELSGVRSNL